MTLLFPPHIASFWNRAEPVLRGDDRLLAVLAAGSAISHQLDEHSDLDLVLVVQPDAYAEVLESHVRYPERIDGLLSAFVGYHVGEPRLVIALYDNPIVHVDFKFVTPDDLSDRIETPVVLFEHGTNISRRLADGRAEWPNRDPQWFEDRFWTWMHYGGVKVARGELFEALAFLSDIRSMVLGPLAARRRGHPQRAIRRVEQQDPAFANRLKATIAAYDPKAIWQALEACMDLYCELRRDQPPPAPRSAAESAVRNWMRARGKTSPR
jgi:hypothetical protein